jgi:hypothetical protein
MVVIVISCRVQVEKSISIKDFDREKKSATEKRKSNRNFFFNENDLMMGKGGGWWTRARHGYPHLVLE